MDPLALGFDSDEPVLCPGCHTVVLAEALLRSDTLLDSQWTNLLVGRVEMVGDKLQLLHDLVECSLDLTDPLILLD